MTLARRAPYQIEIRFLPATDPAPLTCVPDYRQQALDSERPHGPDHDCLVCADARAALGYTLREPVLAAAARRMRERDAGIARIGGEPCA